PRRITRQRLTTLRLTSAPGSQRIAARRTDKKYMGHPGAHSQPERAGAVFFLFKVVARSVEGGLSGTKKTAGPLTCGPAVGDANCLGVLLDVDQLYVKQQRAVGRDRSHGLGAIALFGRNGQLALAA